MTAQGIATVARQEFRLRIRAGRWKVLLALWVAVLVLLTAALQVAASRVVQLDDDGVVLFGGLVAVVLGLALLVVPSLAAQSVNGDRERGTLAALQVTRLSPAEITLGKFVAAWGTALLFLALTVPLSLYAVSRGRVGLSRLVVVTVVLGLLLGSVCAVSLWLSAVLSRTTTSGLLAYLCVAVLTIGTLIVWGLTTAVTQERYQVQSPSIFCTDDKGYESWGGPGTPVPPGCRATIDRYPSSRPRTDRTWFLLAPNPFVILADAAPALPRRDAPGLSERERQAREEAASLDPLGRVGQAARDLRREPLPLAEHIRQEQTGELYESSAQERPTGPVWPYGLAANAALAAAALALTARRLRTPSRTLPRGQRVA